MVDTIDELKDLGLNGIGIAVSYHAGMIAPLMARMRPMFPLRPRVGHRGSVQPMTAPLN